MAGPEAVAQASELPGPFEASEDLGARELRREIGVMHGGLPGRYHTLVVTRLLFHATYARSLTRSVRVAK
jgi:hypothetical protein